MDARSKKSGRIFTGKVATLMLRIGVATPTDVSYVAPKKVVKKTDKKATKPKTPKVKKA